MLCFGCAPLIDALASCCSSVIFLPPGPRFFFCFNLFGCSSELFVFLKPTKERCGSSFVELLYRSPGLILMRRISSNEITGNYLSNAPLLYTWMVERTMMRHDSLSPSSFSSRPAPLLDPSCME